MEFVAGSRDRNAYGNVAVQILGVFIMPEKTLSTIVVEWREEKGDRESVTYEAAALGENRARLRAAQRIEICRSSHQAVTAYRFEYSDGSIVRAV